MVINPSSGDCINVEHYGPTRNFPITPQAVTISNTIFGPDISALRGKTTRKSSDPVVTDYVEIPHRILDLNKEVTLEAYVMFLNGIGLFVRTSYKIKFTTLDYLPSCTKVK